MTTPMFSAIMLAALLAACTATGEQRDARPSAAIGDPSTASASTGNATTLPVGAPTVEKLDLPDEHWRPLVSPEAYKVLFEDDTELCGYGPHNKEKRTGTYVCAACYLPLFESDTKFESGTGWPSFFRPIEGHLGTKEDLSFGMERIEYHCARCGGHQGHVFDDGPEPTGQRYCNNGVALKFIPEGEALPALRGGA